MASYRPVGLVWVGVKAKATQYFDDLGIGSLNLGNVWIILQLRPLDGNTTLPL